MAQKAKKDERSTIVLKKSGLHVSDISGDMELEGLAPGWRPEPGESFEGEVESVAIGYSQFGKYPIVTFDVDGDRVAFHAFHTVAYNEMVKLKPVRGERMSVRYIEAADPADPNSYHNYRIRVLGRTLEDADWSKVFGDVVDDGAQRTTKQVQPKRPELDQEPPF